MHIKVENDRKQEENLEKWVRSQEVKFIQEAIRMN